jgi:hypothetical protein
MKHLKRTRRTRIKVGVTNDDDDDDDCSHVKDDD